MDTDAPPPDVLCEELRTTQGAGAASVPVPRRHAAALPAVASLLGNVRRQLLYDFVLEQLRSGALQRKGRALNKMWHTVGASAAGTILLRNGKFVAEVPVWLRALLLDVTAKLSRPGLDVKLMVNLYHRPCESPDCEGTERGEPMHNSHFDICSADYRISLARSLDLSAEEAHELCAAAALHAPHFPQTSHAISSPISSRAQAATTRELCEHYSISATGPERYSVLDAAVKTDIQAECNVAGIDLPPLRSTKFFDAAATVRVDGHRSISLHAVSSHACGLPSKCGERSMPRAFASATLLVPINERGASCYVMDAILRGAQRPHPKEPLQLHGNFDLPGTLAIGVLHGVY